MSIFYLTYVFQFAYMWNGLNINIFVDIRKSDDVLIAKIRV